MPTYREAWILAESSTINYIILDLASLLFICKAGLFDMFLKIVFSD